MLLLDKLCVSVRSGVSFDCYLQKTPQKCIPVNVATVNIFTFELIVNSTLLLLAHVSDLG